MSEDVAALCDQLEQLRAAATPGVWSVYWGDHIGSNVTATTPSGSGVRMDWAVCKFDDYREEDGNSAPASTVEDDAALIVALVNAAPTLIAAARERDRLRDAVAGLADEHRRWAVINRDLADRMESPDGDFHIGMAQAQESTTRHLRGILPEALPGGEK